MQIGLTMFATDRTMDVVALARAAEERGFHSLYLPEHTHIPVSRRTPPPTGGDTLAEEYRRTLDPLVALAAAASVTERILLGTGICVVAQHEPIVTAKAIATLDALSGGRFVFGIGFGWNADEIEQHGVSMPDRRAVAREHVLAMRAIWRNEVGEFHGEFVTIEPSWSWPKPHRPEGPPVLIGGAAGPKMFAHVAEYADGWIPIGGAGVRAALEDLHRARDEVGRDASTLRIVPFGTVPDAGKLAYYRDLGIREIVLRIPGGDAEAVLPILDEYAALVTLLSRDPEAPAVVALEIGDEPEAWRAAGFSVDGDTARVGGIELRLVGRADGNRLRAWSWCGLTGDGSLDGLVTRAGNQPPNPPGAHANGATALDHVVVVTPRLDRSIAAFEARGLEVRRVRHTDQYGPAFRQVFFRGGETVIELIGPDDPTPDDERPAHFYGLAFTVADLNAAAALLGAGLGRVKDAVQPGRRIATLRHEQYDISVPIALMSP